MFIVTMHYDQAVIPPHEFGRFDSYKVAYEWAMGTAKAYMPIGGYVKSTYNVETWLDGFEAYARSYSALKPDMLVGHVVIFCDDLSAWHAALETTGASKWS